MGGDHGPPVVVAGVAHGAEIWRSRDVRFLLHGDKVAGFPFLASIIAIFSGAQLFALGIIGEYLGRMYVRTLEQPAYVVRETRASSTRT